MLKTWIKFLSRNKFYTAIEFLGLSVSIGFVYLLFSYADTEFSIGRRNPMAREVYAVGAGDFLGMTLETIPTFAPSIPEIESYARITRAAGIDAETDAGFQSLDGYYADPEFFNFFPYRLSGTSVDNLFRSKEEILLSKSTAELLFGQEDPRGREIKTASGASYTVTGTFEDFTDREILYKPAFIMSIKNCTDAPMDSFGSTISFLKLTRGASPEAVAGKLLDKYCEYWDYYARSAEEGEFIWGSTLTRLDRLYFAPIQKYDPIRSGDRSQVLILLVVGLILLVSAVFNYINLSVAETGRRSREMATRRLLGESQASVLWRYLAESFLFTTGCFVTGFAIAWLFKPLFCRILSADILFSWRPANIALISLALLAVSLLSGILPAAVIARFKPVDVVKGRFRYESKMSLGRVFIVIQNLISVVLLTMALVMTAQIHFLSNIDPGYRMENLIYVRTDELGGYGTDANLSRNKALLERLKAIPQIKSVGMCGSLPMLCGFNGLKNDQGQIEYLSMAAMDTTSIRMMGFKVSESWSAPLPGTVYISEYTKAHFDVKEQEPILGHEGGMRLTVCGIVENWKPRDVLFDLSKYGDCTALRILGDDDQYRNFLLVESWSHPDGQLLSAMKEATKEVTGELIGTPKELTVQTLEDMRTGQLTDKRNTMLLVIIFMIVSLLISSFGLLAMSMYYTGQQSRQIALRKLFGSDVKAVVWRISRRFLLMTALAVLVSLPLTLYCIRYYLDGFYNRIEYPWYLIAVAALLSLALSLLSILAQTYKAATDNPVETLKQDN